MQYSKIPVFRPDIRIDIPQRYLDIHNRYKDYSMVAANQRLFVENLLLMEFIGNNLNGDFVECGTWKGGMSCAMLEIGGGNRNYHFFDSFEGLPDAKEIDGHAAQEYQRNTESPLYHDNCRADYDEFINLINCVPGTGDLTYVYKGWFEDTLPDYPGNPIAVLRLDGDWYDSTLQCLEALYKHVVPGGIILLDDYDAWEGCAMATHDFLSRNNAVARLNRTPITHIAYLQKSAP